MQGLLRKSRPIPLEPSPVYRSVPLGGMLLPQPSGSHAGALEWDCVHPALRSLKRSPGNDELGHIPRRLVLARSCPGTPPSCASSLSLSPLPESTTDVLTVSTDAPATPLPLGPNDVLLIVVPQRPEFTAEAGFRISPAGSISLPIVGNIHVGGRTVEEAREVIEEALAVYVREPAVGLSVLEYGAHRVYVLGQVTRPGPVVLDRSITALASLSLVQGLKEGARRDRIALMRRHGPDEVEVYFFNAATPGPAAFVQLRNEEVVIEPRSGCGVFRDEALPILQGIGFTTGQVAAVAVAADQF